MAGAPASLRKMLSLKSHGWDELQDLGRDFQMGGLSGEGVVGIHNHQFEFPLGA